MKYYVLVFTNGYQFRWFFGLYDNEDDAIKYADSIVSHKPWLFTIVQKLDLTQIISNK